MSATDFSLLEQWTRTRDAKAFKEIAVRHSGMVFATCRRILGNAADAEDVTQECFVKLTQSRIAVKDSLPGWLHTLAVRRSIDRIRSDKRRARREKQFAEQTPQRAQPVWNDIQEYVDEAIAELPEKLRYPIIHHFLESEGQGAIAESLNVSQPTVSRRIEKGIELVRRALKRRGVTVPTAILAAMLGSEMVEAVPTALVGSLGKLALAGTAGKASSMAGSTSVAGTFALKTLIVGAIVIIVGFMTVWTTLQKQINVPLDTTEPIAQPSRNLPEESFEEAVIDETDKNIDNSETPQPPNEWVDYAPNDSGTPQPRNEWADYAPNDDAKQGGIVEGVVLTSNGVPLANASIILQTSRVQDSPLDNEPVAHTAADGTFRVEGVRLDLNLIFADHPDYSPGWTSISPNPEAIDSVKILLTRGGTVEGRVMVAGVPQERARISVWMGATTNGSITDAYGFYRIERVIPGIMPVALILKQENGPQRESMFTAEIAAGMITVVDFDLPEAASSLEGIVTVDAEPVRKGYIQLSVSSPQGHTENYTTSLGKNGEYRLAALPEGKADMLVVSTEPANIKESLSFDILPNSDMVQDLQLSQGNCTISGNVDVPPGLTTGGIVVFRGEVVMPELTMEAFSAIRSRLVAETRPITGTYVFENLAPGTYTVLVLVSDGKLDNMSDSMGDALFDSQLVTLKEGEEKIVDLRPYPVQ